jgi:hypothetical protein
VTKVVVIGQPGKRVAFKVDCGPNAGRSVTLTTDLHGEAAFTYRDIKGAGMDALSAAFVDSSGATERAAANITWAAPVKCGPITRNLGFAAALRCLAAKPMVQTIVQLGECTVGAASFFAPPLKLARLFGLVAKAKSLEDLLKGVKVPRALAQLVLDLYHAYGAKINPGARLGFQSFQQLRDTLSHVKDAADFVKLLPDLWSAIPKLHVSEVALDVADLTGLTPCVQLLSKVVK